MPGGQTGYRPLTPNSAALEPRSLKVGEARDIAPSTATVRRVANLQAISAAEANAPFILRGWSPPYSSSSQARTFTTVSAMEFVRVTTGNPQGAFLVRSNEISGMTPQQIQVHLALPDVPTHILNVTVPAGTRMQVGFVAPQPNFGVETRGGIQYQILDQIPSQNFGPMRPIE
jgi:hypothetical protein